MRIFLAVALFLSSFASFASDDIVVPKGFVLQKLAPTGGSIAMPKGWHYKSEGTPSGVLWTLSKEDTAKGPYKTGLRIQLLAGVEKGTGKSREDFAQGFIAQKRASTQVVRDCPQTDQGDFVRQCIEVLENVPGADGPEAFHILYSIMWGKTLDMVVVSIFGAPPDNWTSVASTADAMANFVVIGPDGFK